MHQDDGYRIDGWGTGLPSSTPLKTEDAKDDG